MAAIQDAVFTMDQNIGVDLNLSNSDAVVQIDENIGVPLDSESSDSVLQTDENIIAKTTKSHGYVY